jgi:hypothetical protein
MRYKVSEIAPAVDKVLGEQFENMLSPFAPAGTDIPKVDSFKLDIETIEEAASNEASEVSTAKPDEDISTSESPRTELN